MRPFGTGRKSARLVYKARPGTFSRLIAGIHGLRALSGNPRARLSLAVILRALWRNALAKANQQATVFLRGNFPARDLAVIPKGRCEQRGVM